MALWPCSWVSGFSGTQGLPAFNLKGNLIIKNQNMLVSPSLNNTVSQADSPKEDKLVNMRIKGHRYYGYTTITDPATGKNRQIEFALDVGVGETRHQAKAIQSFGRKLEQIERGDLPNTSNLKFDQLAENWKRNPISLAGSNHGSSDNLLILDSTLVPYFGGNKIKEITKGLVRKYLEMREAKGRKESTLRKEIRVLKWVVQSVLKSWSCPAWDFKNKEKEKDEAPTQYDVALMLGAVVVSKNYGDQYQDIASIMAYTGLDTSDVLRICRESFKDGCLVGRRGKTGKRFKVGIPAALDSILTRLSKVVSLDPAESFFQIPCPDTASQAIKKAFAETGKPQFHAKSLRDFYASELYNQGENDNFIQDSLGQVRGSTETKKYTFPSKERLGAVAKKFPDLRVLTSLKKEVNR